MTTTLNGWAYPANKLVTKYIPGVNRRLTLNEDVAPVMLALAADYHKTIRDLDNGKTDEGGYNDRPARLASSRKSNHANGTAMDLNWSEEGAMGSAWGKKFFATTKVKIALLAIKKRYGSVIQWGGDWNAKDYMHFEAKPGSTPAQFKALQNKLGITANGVRK